jgi:hypothetical protein
MASPALHRNYLPVREVESPLRRFNQINFSFTENA